MSITRRRLKDGTYVYDAVLEYGTADGKRERKKRTFKTRRDAEAAERECERLRNAMRNRTGRITVAEYIDRFYWPIASRRLAATSLDTYRQEIDNRILPHLGNVRLDDLDRLRIQRMLDACPTESVSRKALGLLKTILNEAIGDGFMSSNPAKARYAMPPKGKKRDNGLVLCDFRTISRYVKRVERTAPKPVARLVASGLALGLRPEERYALDYEDISLTDATVTVRGAYVTASARYGGVQMKETKTEGSRRVIPMNALFIEHIMLMEDGTGPWITNKDGGRLSPSTGRKMWNRYLDAHPELPRVTLENMRHSFATACLHEGMNVEDVSKMLGHADINTTYRRYVRPDMESLRDGLRKTAVTWY